MEVALTYISNGLVVLGVVIAFFGLFCLVTLHAKPSGRNKEQLELLTAEQITQGKKNAKQAFIYIIATGVMILLIAYVLRVFVGNTFGV